MTKSKDSKIVAQVERWEFFARLIPTCFLALCVGLVTFGIIDFKAAFWLGMGMFACTAVTWWFWTIYTIRHLVITINRASQNLSDIKDECAKLTNDIKALRNDR
jgi:hypothetical protein